MFRAGNGRGGKLGDAQTNITATEWQTAALADEYLFAFPLPHFFVLF